MDTMNPSSGAQPSAAGGSSMKVAVRPVKCKCFVCNVDLENSPDLAVNMENYPIPLYVKIFNHFAKLLVIRDSQKRIVELSPERAKQVLFCQRCHGQVWQLYQLSNSANFETEPVKEHIKLLTNLLKFKFAFGKRNNSKIRNIVTAHADPSKYHISGYWHLRETEFECAQQMYRPQELSSTLAALDVSKLSANRGLYDQSIYFITPCELEMDGDEDEFSERDGDDYDNTFEDDSESDDEQDDIGRMVQSGRIAPIELVQVNMGNEASFEQSQFGHPGSHGDPMDIPFFNVPVGEIKQPRKQILASRVGVSSKAPIIKTIIRDTSGAIKETGELLNPQKPHTKIRDDESDDSGKNGTDPDPHGDGDSDDDDDEECPCPICNKKFPSRKTMIGHLYTHRKPFCDVCRQYFQDEAIYRAHNASRHTGGQEVCFVCQVQFKDRHRLVLHLRVHKNVNTYRCSLAGCTAAFKTKVESIAHLRKCPFLGSCSSMTISSPPHHGSPASDADGGEKSSADDDDEREFTVEEVEVETEPEPKSSNEEDVEMEYDED